MNELITPKQFFKETADLINRIAEENGVSAFRLALALGASVGSPGCAEALAPEDD